MALLICALSLVMSEEAARFESSDVLGDVGFDARIAPGELVRL